MNAPPATLPPKRPSARRRRGLGVAAAVAASVLAVWLAAGYRRPPPPETAPSPDLSVAGDNEVRVASGAPQWKVIKLDEARPASREWTNWVPARVRIDESLASKVGTPLSGRVSAVLVELGQTVEAGAPLFSVASHEIAGLRAEREKAQVDLEAARIASDRVKSLVAEHALPAKEADAAIQALRQAEVAWKLGTSKLEALRVSSKTDHEFTVVAPRSGVVVEKELLPSQEVSADAAVPLLTIADLSRVWVVADIFEADVAGVHEGLPARVTSPSFPDRTLEAPVEIVSSVVDPVRHTVAARLSLPNPDRTLRPNLYAQVRFAVEPKAGSVEVPAGALVSDGLHQYVYVQGAPGDFARREVTGGSVREGKLHILTGLQPGEVVASEGAILLDNLLTLLH